MEIELSSSGMQDEYFTESTEEGLCWLSLLSLTWCYLVLCTAFSSGEVYFTISWNLPWVMWSWIIREYPFQGISMNAFSSIPRSLGLNGFPGKAYLFQGPFTALGSRSLHHRCGSLWETDLWSASAARNSSSEGHEELIPPLATSVVSGNGEINLFLGWGLNFHLMECEMSTIHTILSQPGSSVGRVWQAWPGVTMCSA